jgi:UDP-glucose:tetrahydrobiopterin glucosyltransferase
MKIALMAPLVTPIREPQTGGSQSFLADLAMGLSTRGHDVDVYAATGSWITGVNVIDLEIDSAPLMDTLYRAGSARPSSTAAANDAFSRAYAAVREIPYDVVHNHAFDAPAIELAAILRAPVVHTLHLPPACGVVAALEDVGRGISGRAIVAVSEAQATEWRRVTRIDAVLSPFVPTARIPWTDRPGIGAVYAGRLSPDKGVVEAITIARAAGIHIDVFGDPYDLDYSRDRIAPEVTRGGVTVHTAIPRAVLWERMARAAVVLCPAMWDEPFGMAAAEAQACGTPVVAFERGGLVEAIRDHVTGFLVQPGDIGAAAAAVRSVGSISRRACRLHAEANLDLELSITRHEMLYQNVSSTQRVFTGG